LQGRNASRSYDLDEHTVPIGDHFDHGPAAGPVGAGAEPADWMVGADLGQQLPEELWAYDMR